MADKNNFLKGAPILKKNNQQILKKTSKAGRPKLNADKLQSEVITIKLSLSEKEALTKNAMGMPLSTWIKAKLRNETDVFDINQ